VRAVVAPGIAIPLVLALVALGERRGLDTIFVVTAATGRGVEGIAGSAAEARGYGRWTRGRRVGPFASFEISVLDVASARVLAARRTSRGAISRRCMAGGASRR